MWTCSKCRERVEDGFSVCWNCGTSKDGIEDLNFVREREVEPTRLEERDPTMSVDQLIFVGLNGYAVALDRDTGELVWSNNEMKSGFTALLLDGDRLIVSTNGYMYCLDPLTGRIRWHNPLSGYGVGAPFLASQRGQSPSSHMLHAAAAAAARSTTTTT